MNEFEQSAVEPPSGTTSLVVFTFGLAQVPPHGELPGPLLLRLLADLGLSASAARSAIRRLCEQDAIRSTRHGRFAGYRLGPVIVERQEALREAMTAAEPRWSGAFAAVLHEIPERHRSYRDALRRNAVRLGYGLLRPGLMIATADRWEALTAALPPTPPHSRLLRAEIQLTEADAREVARDVWQLDDLAGTYRRLVASTEHRLRPRDTDRLEGAAALRAFAELARPLYDAIGRDPGLPQPLLPDGWPAAALSATVGRLIHTFAGRIDARLAELQEH